MKKILITGVNSYVGNSFEKWLANFSGKYIIDKLSLRDPNWRSKEFKGYDAILHVAGIAHVSTNPDLEDLYYKVNRDLTVEVALKAKDENVKQFVFLSSIIIYGSEKVINRETIPMPKNFYGKSKLYAERELTKLESKSFSVAIIRPPMIYGEGSKGNYKKLSKLAKVTPIFPDVKNKRSVIFINNLSEFIRLIIENEDTGIFFPQNSEYANTSNLVKTISQAHNKKILFVKIFNPLISWCVKKSELINKLFGTLVYEKELSEYKCNYIVSSFEESIVFTERTKRDGGN